MRHNVHDELYFDDHDGPVHAEEAQAVLTIGDQPVVVAEGIRHRHLPLLTEDAIDLLDLASMWITRHIDNDRVVLIRAPHHIEQAACVAAEVLLDAGVPPDQSLPVALPPGVELPQWMRDLLMI